MKPEQRPLLTREEEAAALKNLLNDPDDEISLRVLQLHYQQMDQSAQNLQGL